ncbi:hypothetical protein [Robbsia andropogonis]|uniref:hypothetical protein n=1 Tax=Robbsia andropogonis TaxID=28092 RepID=UPI0015899916|nr:hypothetical protein [Robbsia andropogonis]
MIEHSQNESRMNKGTIWILSISLFFGFATGLIGWSYEHQQNAECQVRLESYLKDEREWSAALQAKEPAANVLEHVSGSALKRALADSSFAKGEWYPPICSSQPTWVFLIAGGLVCICLFLGCHVAWLFGRAFNKAMRALK